MRRNELRMPVLALAGATVLAAPSAAPAAEQVPIPLTTSEVPGPAAGNTMTADYVQMVGRMAYVWGYPMVNAHNRRAAFAEAPEPGLLGGIRADRACRLQRDAHQLRRPARTVHRLPQPGRGLRRRLHRARQGADGVPGAGLRRPLLGLCALRPAHRRDRPVRQAVRHRAGLLHDRRPRLAGRGAAGHQGCGPVLHRRGFHRAAHLQGCHPRGHSGGAAAAEPGPLLPAERIRRADENQGLEQSSAFPGADRIPAAASTSG